MSSVSSFSSAPGSGVEGLRPNALKPGDDDNIFDEPHTIQLGVFGVLYTVSKEKQLTSVKFAFFRLFLDFLQLWLLVVNPNYGWAINANNKAWQVVSFIQLNSFLSARGYSFFLGMLYVFVGLLGVNLALSVWVAHSFSNNRFEYVWPIQFLRWFGLIFYQVLDIATLTLLLVTLDCNYFNVPEELKFHNQEFPEIMCWSMPHIIHVTVSVASIVLFVLMATCMVLSEMELNPLTRNYMAVVHTSDEGVGFAIKTILTIASVMLSSSTKVLSVVYIFFFAVLFYTYIKWVPFIYSTLNYVRCASYGMVMYSSMLLVVLAYGPSGEASEQFSKRVTLALWIGMAPAALAGAFLCYLRLRHFHHHVLGRFRDAEPGTNTKSIYRFTDAREVEISARCCRCWIDEDTLEPNAVTLSEQIIKAGMMQLPQDPHMIILYSSFLIDVQGSYQSGYTQLQTAKKQSLGLLQRFAIFSREQEHTQKASGANSGDSAVDLVSYVEFQRNHRLVVRAHREALLAIRSFWGLLLRTNVDFNNLSKALNRIEVTVKAAERAYRGVLVRHASSARIVRLYGRFLETVKFDPWAASKWYTEADQLEEEAEHSKEALQLGGIEELLPQGAGAGNSGDRGLLGMEGVAFICINAQGTIQVASPEAHSMLGYGKNELKGRDVGIIMPHPFSERHTAYVRNYVHTGVSTMLGRHLEVMVITKSRLVFPVKMHVTKVSGLNEDSVFLGMLEPLPPSPDDARLWILGNGAVVAADALFCDWLGYDAVDVAGKPLDELLVEKEAVREGIKTWNRTHQNARQPHHLRNRRHSSNLGEGFLSAVINVPSPMLGEGSKHEGGKGEGGKAGGAIGWMRRASFVEHSPAPPSGAAAHGSVHNGDSMQAPPVVMPRAAWRHKFWDPLEFDTFIQPGAVGSVKVHSVIIRRCSARVHGAPRSNGSVDPYYHSMLLVADHKGHLLHVTATLAAELGRSAENIRAGGLAMLIPEPISVMHGPWLQELSNPQSMGSVSQLTPPPYSCRSGVAVSLCAYSEQHGPGVKQFKVGVTQRLADGGGSKIHVVSLSPLSLDQALSERRLKLTLDLEGTIIDADESSPTDLFGALPRALVGSSISELLDVFQIDELDEAFAAAMQAGSEGQEAAAGIQSDYFRKISKALLQLAKRSSDNPDCSWRVGVNLIPDEQARAELQHLASLVGPEEALLASQLLGATTIPAVLKVRLVRRSPPRDPDPMTPNGAYASAADGGGSRSQRLGYGELHSGYNGGGGGSLGSPGPPGRSMMRNGDSMYGVDVRSRINRHGDQPPESYNGFGGQIQGARLYLRNGESTVASDSRNRVTILSHGESRHGYMAGGGGGGGILLSHPIREMRSPVRLDAAGMVERRPLSRNTSLQRAESQGVWGAVAKAAAGAESDGSWQQGRGGRGAAGAMGPVAEATERHESAMTLDAEDEAVLEQLESSICDTAMTPPAAARPPPLEAVPSPPFSAPMTGASAVAAAVAAAVERSSSNQLINRNIGHLTPRTSGVLDLQVPGGPMSQRHLVGAAVRTASPAGSGTTAALAPAAAAAVLSLPVPRPSPADRAAVVAPSMVSLQQQQQLQQLQQQQQQRLQQLQQQMMLQQQQQLPGSANICGPDRTSPAWPGGKPKSLRLPPDVGGGDTELLGEPPIAAAPHCLVLEVELWRADLLTGVLEVDEKGRVLRADAACPLGQASLVLGTSPSAITGVAVNDLIPLPPGGVTAMLDAANASGPDAAVRGALKKRPVRPGRLGASLNVTVRHHSDGCAMDLHVRAVRRTGPNGSAFLCVRPAAPKPVQPGFLRWLYDNDMSGLMPGPALPTAPTQGTAAIGGKWQQLLTRVVSIDRVAAMGRSGSPPKFGPATGAASMSLADKAAALTAGITALTSSLPGSPMARSLMPTLTGVESGPNDMPASATLQRTTGNGLASSSPPMQTSPPSTNPGDTVVTPLRVAALRSSLLAANGQAPSRLSIISVAEHNGDIAGGGTGAVSASAVLPRTSTDPEVLVSNMSLDTAYDPARARGLDAGLDDRPAGQRMRAPAASLPGNTMLREGASLMPPEDAAFGLMHEAPRKGKMAESKVNMIQSWVLNSTGHDPVPQGKADACVASNAGKSSFFRDPPSPDPDRLTGGSEGSAAEGDGMSVEADGERRSSASGMMGETMSPKSRGGAGDSGRDGGTEDVESEAGAMVANYSVGKRFKKLHKILMSPLALQPARQLRWRTLAAVALMLTAHTITFALLLTKLIRQQAAVEDLNSVALATRVIHEVAINGRVLDRLYAGNSYVEGLPQFGVPLQEGLDDMYEDLTSRAQALKDLHHGVYLGFRTLRRIPTDFGLRDIWDVPRLDIAIFYDLADPTTPNHLLNSNSSSGPYEVVKMGLWDAGNMYLAKTLDLVNNGPKIVAAGVNFTEWATWRFIHDNGVSVIFPAYHATLDALVQLTVVESKAIYELQLIVLCLEGGLLCIMMCVYMWIVAHKYSHKRHDLYGVFIQIPVGVTRGLANMSLNLEPTDEEEDDDDLQAADANEEGAMDVGEGVLTDGAIKAVANEKRNVRTDNASIAGAPAPTTTQKRRTSLSFGLKAVASEDFGDNPPGDGTGKAGGVKRAAAGFVSSFMVWRRRSRVTPQTPLGGKSKRRLVQSHGLAYMLVAPFIAWGTAIIAVNLVGYYSLESLTAPIATLNVVNVVVIRFHRALFYMLEVAAALSEAVSSAFKPVLGVEVADWKKEYAAMLYGSEAVPNSNSPHFELAKTGVVFGGFSGPVKLLYHTGSCLNLDHLDCQPVDSPYYQVSRNGLDVLLKTQFSACESLVAQPASSSGLNSTEFHFLWATGQTDVEGGLTRMATLFLDEVQGSYTNVAVQQIVMFCIAWVWAFLVLVVQLRPLVRKAHSEMRRIAELLSQLPGEVDCETMVTAVILGERAKTVVNTAGNKTGHGSEQGGTTMSGMKRRSSIGGIPKGPDMFGNRDSD